MVWLVLDTQLAGGMGYRFEKLSNGVVVSSGDSDSQIHMSVFFSAWLSDTQRIAIPELLAYDTRIVIIDQGTDGYPDPQRIPSESPESLRSARKKSRSQPDFSPIPELSVSDYRPQSPTPTELELQESERPPSWSPAGISPPPKKARPITPSSSAVTDSAASPELRPPAVTQPQTNSRRRSPIKDLQLLFRHSLSSICRTQRLSLRPTMPPSIFRRRSI